MMAGMFHFTQENRRSLKLPGKPVQVWSVLKMPKDTEEFKPVHHVTAFHEDHGHDWWNEKRQILIYSGIIREGSGWLYVIFEKDN